MNKDENFNEILQTSRLEPFTLVRDILVNWWVILLGGLAAAMLAATVLGLRWEPAYTTSATFAVSSRMGASSYSDLNSATEMAGTFQKILKSSALNKILCEELGVDSINATITSNVIPNTNLLELSVSSSSPREAFDTIHAIMDNYSQVSYFSLGNAVMEPLDQPAIPMYPSNPLNTSRAMKLAFLVTAAALAALFGLLSFFRDTVKQEDDVEAKLDTRSLGALVYEPKAKSLRELFQKQKKALLVNQPLAGFGFVESYRKFVSKLEYQMEKHHSQVLVVSSVSENEGKSTVAANIAISLVQRGKKVLVIDGDLRRPSQFLILGIETQDKNELGEYLKSGRCSDEIITKTSISGLYFMGGRNCYSMSTDMLQSGNIEKLLKTCRRLVDYVVIDTPPAGPLGDAELFARYADEVLLVVRQNYMLAEDINDVLDHFREVGCHVVGVVLNRVQSFENLTAQTVGRYAGRYGYGYGYGYGAYAQYANDRGEQQ